MEGGEICMEGQSLFSGDNKKTFKGDNLHEK